eukprot:1024583-Pyramimonas_sp.AAC.1
MRGRLSARLNSPLSALPSAIGHSLDKRLQFTTALGFAQGATVHSASASSELSGHCTRIGKLQTSGIIMT